MWYIKSYLYAHSVQACSHLNCLYLIRNLSEDVELLCVSGERGGACGQPSVYIRPPPPTHTRTAGRHCHQML